MRLKWVLENNEMVRHLANEGHVMFGTIDTWLVYKLTEGKVRHYISRKFKLFKLHLLY